MKICFICDEYPPYKNGGIGTFTKELAEGLVAQDNKVFVVGCYNNIERDSISYVNGVKVYRLVAPYNSQILARIKLFKRIKRLDLEYQIDLLESPEVTGFIAFWPSTRFKILIRLHGSITYLSREAKEWPLKNYIWFYLEKLSLRRANNIVSVSEYTAKRTKKYFSLEVNIPVIYNGVAKPDGVKTNYEIKEGLKVIFAGSLLVKKGFLALAMAWNRFNLEFPSSKILIAGKNNNDQLDSFLSCIDNKSSVEYLGVLKKSELNSFYEKVDVAIFPSFIECFSLAPMESMYVGVPTIFTELVSGKELIDHGINGLLINPGYPETIYSALRKIYFMPPNERKNIGTAGSLLIANKFDTKDKVEENINFYASIISDT
jgi:glycosyltransferase involved in cell wall biosynthesis